MVLVRISTIWCSGESLIEGTGLIVSIFMFMHTHHAGNCLDVQKRDDLFVRILAIFGESGLCCLHLTNIKSHHTIILVHKETHVPIPSPKHCTI